MRGALVRVALGAAIGAALAGSVPVHADRGATMDSAPPAAGLWWKAPSECPRAAAVRDRVEARLGASIEGSTVLATIVVRRTGTQLVATVRLDHDAPRTLTSAHCDQLVDAVSLIVARRERERRVELGLVAPAAAAPVALALADVPLPAAAAAPAGRASPAVTAAPVELTSARQPGAARPLDPTQSVWGGGLRALAVTGVGALPGIGVAAEVAGYVRRRSTFAELAAVHWARSSEYGGGARGNVQLGLDTLGLRVGWVPAHTHVRSWATAEVGRLTGTGTLNEEMGGARTWVALGAGAAVAWPMADRARLVGTFEVVVPLDRSPYLLSDGRELHRPAVGSARCSLGFEVGWW